MQECRCSAIRDAFGIERPNDGRSRPDDVGHDGGLFLSVQFENGLAVSVSAPSVHCVNVDSFDGREVDFCEDQLLVNVRECGTMQR